MTPRNRLAFEKRQLGARIIDTDGRTVEKPVEIRTHPITGRSCRITYARGDEKESGYDSLPEPPPDGANSSNCPFCRPQVMTRTPRLVPELSPEGRMTEGGSILFPNLFPYGRYSAVSLLDNHHYVEIGTACPASYRDSLANCQRYLDRVHAIDPAACYTAVTQNHLPSAGGSLVHPHLQVHADRVPANHQRFYADKARQHDRRTGTCLFSDYLNHEKSAKERIIGTTGNWQWLAAFAPEGFYEIWGILPQVFSLTRMTAPDRKDLAEGICNCQRFYRHLNRNGYNLGILSEQTAASRLELRVVILARANHAPWVRSDHTGFETMLGDMATFTPPEQTARLARAFWK